MFRGPSFIVSTMQGRTTPIFNVFGMTGPSSNRESNPQTLLVSAGCPISLPFYDQQVKEDELVFMVRGIVNKWKQPFGYFLSSSPMQGSNMATLLKEAISLFQEIGLHVLVVVCDQGSNNRNLFEKQLGVEKENPCLRSS